LKHEVDLEESNILKILWSRQIHSKDRMGSF
jgi:hypothetical protein